MGTEIITETISKVDLSQRPFKYWREGEEDDPSAFETASTYDPLPPCRFSLLTSEVLAYAPSHLASQPDLRDWRVGEEDEPAGRRDVLAVGRLGLRRVRRSCAHLPQQASRRYRRR